MNTLHFPQINRRQQVNAIAVAFVFAFAALLARLLFGWDGISLMGGISAATVYTPATLITAKVMGNGGANIATWRYQNTGGATTFGIVRHATFASAAARAVTVEQGSTAADTAAQKILDAQPIAANQVYELKGWITIQNNDYFEGFANNTDVVAAAYGFTSTP